MQLSSRAWTACPESISGTPWTHARGRGRDHQVKLRVGDLGAGAWAEFAHLPGFKRDTRCELVAIADPVRTRAADLAAKFAIPHAYGSHEELLVRKDIDVVDVCAPNVKHFELAWAALEAGKHRS